MQPFPLHRRLSRLNDVPAPAAHVARTCILPVEPDWRPPLDPTAPSVFETDEEHAPVFELARRRTRRRRVVVLHLEEAFPDGAPWQTTRTISFADHSTLLVVICFALVTAMCAGYAFIHRDRPFRSGDDPTYPSWGFFGGDTPSP